MVSNDQKWERNVKIVKWYFLSSIACVWICAWFWLKFELLFKL